ncbi:hypothetical protein N9H03_01710 [Flavobacteriales bacterium]|nr:hypothetical protein [Flavobacteriales bacterium]
MISDGKRYFDEAENYVLDSQRKAWGLFNYAVKKYDYLPRIFIKFMNIPVLFIFIFYLQKTFSLINYKLLFTFPYLFFLSMSNLRDILIWLSALMIIRFFYLKKSLVFFLVFFTLLIFLRPMMILSIGAFIVVFYLYKNILTRKSNMRKYKRLNGLFVFILLVGSVFFFRNDIQANYNRTTYNLSYLYLDNLDSRLDARAQGAIQTNNLGKALMLGAVRYVSAPIPTSKIANLLSDNPEVKYGYFSEYLRLIGQISYYFMIIYITLNFKKSFLVLKEFNIAQKAYLFWLFSFFPIYGFYHFGAGHQRLKLPFQIFIFIIFIYLYHHKRKEQLHG